MLRPKEVLLLSLVAIGCGSVTAVNQPDAGNGGPGGLGVTASGGDTQAGAGGTSGGTGGESAIGGRPGTGGAPATGGSLGTGGTTQAAGTGGTASTGSGGVKGSGGAAGSQGTGGAFPACSSLGWTFDAATACTSASTGEQASYGALPCLQGCVNHTSLYYATQDCTDKDIDPGANSLCVLDCSICK